MECCCDTTDVQSALHVQQRKRCASLLIFTTHTHICTIMHDRGGIVCSALTVYCLCCQKQAFGQPGLGVLPGTEADADLAEAYRAFESALGGSPGQPVQGRHQSRLPGTLSPQQSRQPSSGTPKCATLPSHSRPVISCCACLGPSMAPCALTSLHFAGG